MSGPLVKICGFTRAEDLRFAVDLGIWGAGFILWPKSQRCISWKRLESLIQVARQCSDQVKTVGVMVNPQETEVRTAISCGLDLIQFHGEESVEFCESFQHAYIKALRPKNVDEIMLLACYTEASYFLLDAFVKGAYGGTGHQIEAGYYRHAKSLPKPVFLAGGIQPRNVQQTMGLLQPDGLDLSSGVETQPGIKSTALMQQLWQLIKSKDSHYESSS